MCRMLQGVQMFYIFKPAERSTRSRWSLGISIGALVLGSLVSASAFAAQAADRAEASVSKAEEIVVTGTKSSTVLDAIAEKRLSVGVTSIMSREEIADRPGGNIVDIISHLPGLSSFSDMGLGQAATGEQEYVTIRGIDSSYNAYDLNGIRVPQADPGSRALSLKLLPPYGIEAVKVTKTPTVDMDGDAIGGVIDIRTPTAFDFKGSMTRVTFDGTIAQLASQLGATSGGAGGQFELARRFGSNGQFGIYITGYYDERNSAGEAIEALGYTPTLAADATQADFTKVSGLSATGVRYDYYRNNIKRYGGNASLNYQQGGQKFYLQGSYSRYSVTGEDTQHSIIDGIAGLYSNGKSFSPVGILPGSYFQERDQKEELITAKLGGSTDIGRLTVEYSGSFGRSSISRPNYVEGSLYGSPNLTGSATNLDLSNPAHTKVTYDSLATQAYTLSQTTDRLWKFQGSDSGSAENMYAGRIDLNYRVGRGLLDNLRAGVNVNIAKRSQSQHQFFGNNGDNFVILGPDGAIRPFNNPAGPTVAALPGRNLSSFLDGSYAGVFRIYDRSTFENAVLPFKYTDQFARDPATGQIVGNPGAYTANDYNRNTVYGTESIYTGYAEANFQLGALRAITGLRFEQTDFSSRQWVVDGNTGNFQSSGNKYGELLPSLIVVYRPNPSIVARAAIRRSFARPAFGLIASPRVISRNDLTGQIASISQGNPNLKAAESTNYDASIEYYGHGGTILEVNAYYKQISNFIYAATTAGDAPNANIATVANGGIITSIPQNGNDAEIYGMELDLRHYLRSLPGFLGGFGVGGSLTLQHSSANSGRADHFGRKTWLPRAPETIYNLDLFYDKYGVKADLAYQYQGLQLLSLNSSNIDTYLQPVKTLDFSISYPVRSIVFTGAVKNLTDNILFYKTLGKSTRYLGTQDGGGNGSYVATGRMFTVSASYKF